MRIVGHTRLNLPALMPGPQGLAAARIQQATTSALAAGATTGVARGIYRFASHDAMNRATDEALVRTMAAQAARRSTMATP